MENNEMKDEVFVDEQLSNVIANDTVKDERQMSDEIIVSMENVSKIYISSLNKLKRDLFKQQDVKSVKALDEVSMEVKKGEIYGLLGANGSGKTTIIKLLCGLIRDDGGKIKVLGSDVTQTREYLKDVGAIVEAPSMFKDLTGRENLRYFASLSGGLHEQRIQDILDLVGLKDRADSKFGTYSLGMQQRLGIAQAIMTNPKLLILDEPINGLDPDGIMQMRDLLRKLNSTYGTTIIISSHILSEMQELCDRVAILVKGKIVAVKSLKEVESTQQKEIAKIDCSDPQKAYELISDIKDVEVKLVNGAIYIKCEADKIALVNKTLVKNDIDIYGLTIRKRTLEDIYKELA